MRLREKMAFESPPPLPVGKIPGDLLARLIAGHQIGDPAVVIGPGIGRDAAALAIGEQIVVVKSDPITFATDSAAHYLVNVNANDLACLGAVPRWMLVTALLPEGKTTEADVESLFRELQAACAERSIALVGGHTEVSGGLDHLILVGQLMGLAPSGRLLAPGGGKPGDRLLLTKALALEGTALLARERAAELASVLSPSQLTTAADLLHSPGISIVPEAEALITSGSVSALHDPTEGGFATGVCELAQASECGLVVDEALVPILPETRIIADHLGLDPLGMLASGSLLAAISPAATAHAEAALRAIGIPFSWIGKLTTLDHGKTLIRHGQRIRMPAFAADEVARYLAAQPAESLQME